MATIIAEATGKRTKTIKNVPESEVERKSESLADLGYTRITVEREPVRKPRFNRNNALPASAFETRSIEDFLG